MQVDTGPGQAAPATRVERALRSYLDARAAELTAHSALLGPAVAALSAFVLGGGKRLRPTFAWWAWRGAGGETDGPAADAVVHAVSALELIQACALVHDDLIDESATRRGSPTVHIGFAKQHAADGLLGDPQRFGNAVAVLLGDLALALADDMLVDSGLSARQLDAARVPWRAMRSEMLAGQYLDVLGQARGDESPEAALRVAALKTAAYTVERPLHLGAALAGAPEPMVSALRAFGADLGLAFQLRDDLLGVFGDSAVTGKPAGDDLREGKRTLLVAEGVRLAADPTPLREALGDPELDADGVERVRTLLVEVGAVAAVERRIEALTDSAMSALRTAHLAEPAGQRLAELAVAATRRTR